MAFHANHIVFQCPPCLYIFFSLSVPTLNKYSSFSHNSESLIISLFSCLNFFHSPCISLKIKKISRLRKLVFPILKFSHLCHICFKFDTIYYPIRDYINQFVTLLSFLSSSILLNTRRSSVSTDFFPCISM